MKLTTICLLGFISLNSQVICHRFFEMTYPQVTLTKLSGNGPYIYNSSEEERMKLCYYAKLTAGLPYIDSSYVPEWKELYVPTKLPEPFGFGMYCATLPTIYLIRHSKNYKTIQITYLESQVGHYKFDMKSTIPADSIILRADRQEAFEGTNLVTLSPEDRRNLCVAAREYVTLQFLDYNVPPAQAYEFRYAGKIENDVAISCPTSPQLYLRRGDSETEVKLFLFPNLVDEYEFEANSMKPSSVIRVPEARLYSFKYDNEEEQVIIAIVCPAMPSMFLYLDDTSFLDNLIKITFLKGIAEQYSYKIIKFGSRPYEYFYELQESRIDKLDRQLLEEHSFSKLNKENRWNLCLGAQKDLVADHDIVFDCTKEESINRHYKMLLIPRFMKDPKVYAIGSIVNDSKQKQKVVLVQCSTMPNVHISLGKIPNLIEIWLEDL